VSELKVVTDSERLRAASAAADWNRFAARTLPIAVFQRCFGDQFSLMPIERLMRLSGSDCTSHCGRSEHGHPKVAVMAHLVL
jgi:hypothetical protein